MGKRDSVALKSEQMRLEDIAAYYNDADAALRLFYSQSSLNFSERFLGYRQKEVDDERSSRLAELEVTCSMTLLAKLEASLRVDYLIRCRARKRDTLSRHFRIIYRQKLDEVPLDDILDSWNNTHPKLKSLVGDLRGALHYRHWIAHGRYWEPKLARRRYDYVSVYTLVEDILATFSLAAPS